MDTIFDRALPAGEGALDWLPGLPAPFPSPGVYFLRLTIAGQSAGGKIVIAR